MLLQGIYAELILFRLLSMVTYKIVEEESGVYKIYNEQGKISEFGVEVSNFFEIAS